MSIAKGFDALYTVLVKDIQENVVNINNYLGTVVHVMEIVETIGGTGMQKKTLALSLLDKMANDFIVQTANPNIKLAYMYTKEVVGDVIDIAVYVGQGKAMFSKKKNKWQKLCGCK